MVRSTCTCLVLLALGVAVPSSVAAQDSSHKHVVREGETLSTLAQQYLGDGERWPEIAQANPGSISDPNLIPTGVELRIPDSPPSESADDRSADETLASVNGGSTDIDVEPLTTEERLLTVVQGDRRSDVQPTVFARRGDHDRPAQVLGEEAPLHYAVPPDVFYSAEWLVLGEVRPLGGGGLRDFVTMPEARRFQGSIVRPFDRVSVDLVEGFSPAVGEEVQVFRVIRRDDQLGWVVKPTGSLTIVKTEGPSVVGEVNRQFHNIALGDRIRAAARFPLQRGQLARDAELGSMSATIIGWGSPRRLQQMGDVAFLDVGSNDGVAVGDEFVIAAETDQAFNDNIAGRLQVVGVDDEVASARILTQDGPVFRRGTTVYLAKKMQ